MPKLKKRATLLLLASSVISISSVFAEGNYDVTITNITRGQVFTPILVATHTAAIKAFTLGSPAVPELAILAESGNTEPAISALSGLPSIAEVKDSGGVLPPGQSVTVTVNGGGDHAYITVLSMLIPTNDAFMAVNAKLLPMDDKPMTFYTVAYDAGSEMNSEFCADIPGPPAVCSGEGVSSANGEGYVHIHSGIHGGGDLAADTYDWRNPVAKIVIQRSAAN